MGLEKNRCLSKNEDMPYNMIEGEAVLIDLDENEIIRLNEAGSEIWRLIDGKRTVGDIIHQICEIFEVEEKEAERDTIKFLRTLIRIEAVR